jgi:hypothetical protein
VRGYVIGLDPSQLRLVHGQLSTKLTNITTQLTNIMADNDIATRAPESDAQETPQEQPQEAKPAEESVFPGDSRAQEGPSMGVSRTICSRAMLHTGGY